jgi:ABC-type protease/lipase transport system fused ATPase/permease subunit
VRVLLLVGSLVLIASVALNVYLLTRPRREESRRRDVRSARKARAEAERRMTEALDMLVAVELVVHDWDDAESMIATKVREITRRPDFIRFKHDRDITSRPLPNPDITMES